MPDGSEFHTVGAATLKPQEAKVVRTRGTDSRLVLYLFDGSWSTMIEYFTCAMQCCSSCLLYDIHYKLDCQVSGVRLRLNTKYHQVENGIGSNICIRWWKRAIKSLSPGIEILRKICGQQVFKCGTVAPYVTLSSCVWYCMLLEEDGGLCSCWSGNALSKSVSLSQQCLCSVHRW